MKRLGNDQTTGSITVRTLDASPILPANSTKIDIIGVTPIPPADKETHR